MSDEKAGDSVGKVVIVDEVIVVEMLIQTVVDTLAMLLNFVVDNQLTT